MASTPGSGKLNAYLDDFRFWKKRRSGRQIKRWYASDVGGGTNRSDPNISLGVYYKFNEGIFGQEKYDTNILDYSGRASNSTWQGKPPGLGRIPDSAIFTSTGRREFRDPVIYRMHPDVQSLLAQKIAIGSVAERDISSQLWTYLPHFIVEENELDDPNSDSDLRNLLDIMGSYFDELYLQIEAMNEIKSLSYDNFENIPAPFVKRMLEHCGLESGEIFIDATIHEMLHVKNDDLTYERNLYDVKNLIYKNIYNNLNHIYKSKGTIEGFRGLMRCFGIDEEIVKINLYATDTEYKLEDNYSNTTIRKKFIDFDSSPLGAMIVGIAHPSVPDSEGTVGPLHFVADNNTLTAKDGPAMSLETEFVFPSESGIVTSSMFGFHQVDLANINNIPASPPVGTADFQVYAIGVESPLYEGAQFRLEYRFDDSVGPSPFIESSFFSDVYEDTKWNFCVSVFPSAYPFMSEDNSLGVEGYVLRFSGISTSADEVINEFSEDVALTLQEGRKFLNGNKRFYLGAKRSSFDFATSDIVHPCNVKPGHMRLWMSKIENSELRQHAIKPLNYGVDNPMFNVLPTFFDAGFSRASGVEIPKASTLMFDWAFDELTASDQLGQMLVNDLSSGSIAQDPALKTLRERIDTFYPAQAYGFNPNDPNALDKKYIFAGKLSLPESISSDDTIRILSQDDVHFTLDSKPKKMFLAIEKSMYQNISQEMLKVVHSMAEFSTLVGSPVDKYRHEYKGLNKLREIFYQNVENTPDLDRYIEFYKWFDRSLSEMLVNLVPATANNDLSIKNMVESHALERNKYQHKFPTFEMQGEPPETIIRGHAELGYNWRFGHAPVMIPATATITFTGQANMGGEFITLTAGSSTLRVCENNVGGGVACEAVRWERAAGDAPQTAINLAAAINALELFEAQVDPQNALRVIVTSLRPGTVGLQDTISFNENGQSGAAWELTAFAGAAGSEDENCLWWKERAERDDLQSPINVGGANDLLFDVAREEIREAIVYQSTNDLPDKVKERNNIDLDSTARDVPKLTTTVGANRIRYEASPYFSRRLNRHMKLDLSRSLHLHGGVNFEGNKNHSFALNHLKLQEAGPIIGFGVRDIMIDLATLYDHVCDDEKTIRHKRRLHAQSFIGAVSGDGDDFDADANLVAPFSIYESEWDDITTRGGYYAALAGLRSQDLPGYPAHNLDVTNLHVDSYGDDRAIPIQGPFAAENVGGLQHRNVKFGDFPPQVIAPAAQEIRPQAFTLQSFVSVVPGNELQLLFVRPVSLEHVPNPNNPLQVEVSTTPRHLYRRSESAKRPLNIRNIKDSNIPSSILRYSTATLSWGETQNPEDYYEIRNKVGNYHHDYEIVQINGRDVNNRDFIKVSGGASYNNLSLIAGHVNRREVEEAQLVQYADVVGRPGRNPRPPGYKNVNPAEHTLNNKHIISERFNAPGDPKTMMRGGTDPLSEQYSPYNALPFRNLIQINRLKERNGMVYYGEATNVVQRTEHKVHRNTLVRKLVYDFSAQPSESVPMGWTGDGAKVMVV